MRTQWDTKCTLLAASSLMATACTPPLTGDVGDQLTRTGGCGDTFVYAADADDTIELSVFAEGLIAAAGDAPSTRSFTLPDAAVRVRLEQGDRITSATCTDLIENGGPKVVRTYTATAGTVDVTVRPGGADGWDSEADVTLTDATLATEGGQEITIDAFTWTAIWVGWLPG
jgi:hypothetical protein